MTHTGLHNSESTLNKIILRYIVQITIDKIILRYIVQISVQIFHNVVLYSRFGNKVSLQVLTVTFKVFIGM